MIIGNEFFKHEEKRRGSMEIILNQSDELVARIISNQSFFLLAALMGACLVRRRRPKENDVGDIIWHEGDDLFKIECQIGDIFILNPQRKFFIGRITLL